MNARISQLIKTSWPLELNRQGGRSLKEHLNTKQYQAIPKTENELAAINALIENQSAKEFPKPQDFKVVYKDGFALLDTKSQLEMPKWKTFDFLLPLIKFQFKRVFNRGGTSS